MLTKGLRKYLLLLVFCLSLVFVSVGDSVYFVNETPTSQFTVDNADENGGAVAYIIGKESVKYTSVERALTAASNGETVTLIPPTQLNYPESNSPDKIEYTITKNATIKEGVTLLIPTDQGDVDTAKNNSVTNLTTSMREDAHTEGNNWHGYAEKNPTRYLRITLNIAPGVTLTNAGGTLVVSGYLSGGNSGQGYVGQTCHSYSRMMLGEGASYVQSSGTTYCFGFISESSLNNGSKTDFKDGNLYVPMSIPDCRGFSFSWAMTEGAIDNQHCSPFNQFEFRNIDVESTFRYEIEVIACVNLFISYSSSIVSVAQSFPKAVPLISKDTAENPGFIQFTDATYSSLVYKFNPQTEIADIHFIGGMSITGMSLEFSASGLTVDLSTTNAFFPLSWRQQVYLEKGEGQTSASFDSTTQRIKVLPGSRLEIGEGCTLNSRELSVYSAFYDGTKGDGEYSVNGYNWICYPLKEAGILIVHDGATVSSTYLGGNVYIDNGTITTSSGTTVTSKEAWSYGNSGGYLPPWATNEYLEIRETLQKSPISYLERQKIYAGSNTFSNYSSYAPNYQVIVNKEDGSSETFETGGYQKVFFADSISSYSLEFVANVYRAKKGESNYIKDEVITYNASSPYVCGINSILSISNNNNGVNEFDVQSITITCSTPTVNGVVPLYPGTTINLVADVVDIDKSYNKTLVWSSSDETIATVDQEGKVTGIALGDVVISATCDGVTGTYNAKVQEEQELIAISDIEIVDGSGNSSKGTGTYDGSYGNNQTITFTLKITPSNAAWGSIKWTFTASQTGRQYINDKEKQENTVENVESVQVHTVSGTGTSDDPCSLKCEVTDLLGNPFTETFSICHEADVTLCVTGDTQVLMADGTEKYARDIQLGDMICSYDHYEGKFEVQPVVLKTVTEKETYHVLKLIFDDGSSIETINGHNFFSYDTGGYERIEFDNVEEYLGQHFYTLDHYGNEGLVKLVDYEEYNKVTEKCGFNTYENMNAVTNGLLSMPEDDEKFCNFFEVEPGTLKFDEEIIQADIERYGLFTYEELSELFTEVEFKQFNIKWAKIALGRGILREEEIYWFASYYLRDSPTVEHYQ